MKRAGFQAPVRQEPTPSCSIATIIVMAMRMQSSTGSSTRSVRRYTASQFKLIDRFFELVLSGEKTSTIRYGFVFVTNELLPLCSGARRLFIRILKIDYTKTFASLRDEDAVSDGFQSVEQLRSELLRFYPHIQPEDPVTIFHFEVTNNAGPC
jgi:hypothetical protein